MKKLRILFAIQYAPIWPSLRSVFNALIANDSVIVKVIKTPFIQPIASDDYWTQIDNLFSEEGITVEPNAEEIMKSFNPHLVFLQNPYDATRELVFKSINLFQAGYKIAYVPYGIEMGGGDKNIRGQFNTDVQKLAWRVFLRSKRNKAMYAKHCDVGDSHVVVSGHPKFDNQQDFATYTISDALKQKIAGRKVVLWSPHFSVGLPASWSTYRIYNQMIMQQVEARSDVFFIIRPHPLFFKEMLRQQVWNEADEATFRKLCLEKDNLWLDENADYMESFAASDAIMTDVGSFLLEYLPTKNPIMYLHHPEGYGLNDDGDLVDHYYRANLPDDIPPFIDLVSKGLDPMRDKRISITDEFLFGLDGKAGQRIADYIVEELTKELNDTEWHAIPQSEEALQNKVDYYWKNAPSTLIAPPIYYELKDKAYKEALALLPKVTYAVDLGCGEGRYTLPLSKKCGQLDAFDISPKLIHVANQRKQKFNVANVSFVQANYQQMQLKQQPDLFSCSDLTSSIIDNREFAKLIHAIKANLTDQGLLMLSDQFSLGQEDKIIQAPSGIVSKIRSLALFKQFMASLGMSIVSEATITESVTHGITSKLFLLTKAAKLDYLNDRSKDYWTKSVNSFLAPKEFYQVKKNILENLISELPQLESMIDIGCGNGYFTNLFSNVVKQIKGYDIAPALINEAKEEAKKQSITNIEFYQSDMDNLPSNEQFNLVACMGVTNCFVDDIEFANLIQKLVGMVSPNGYLLVSDRLSINKARLYSREDGYVSKYRDIESYLSAFFRHNLSLKTEKMISFDESQV